MMQQNSPHIHTDTQTQTRRPGLFSHLTCHILFKKKKDFVFAAWKAASRRPAAHTHTHTHKAMVLTTADDLGISMPEPTVPRRPFPSFKVLSFDIYGTLIDWETGIIRGLSPTLTAQIPDGTAAAATYRHAHEQDDARIKLAEAYHEVEAAVQAEAPQLLYAELLAQVYLRLAARWGVTTTERLRAEAEAFGRGCGSWGAFADTVEAMKRLGKHFKLVPLSNVDRESFSRTCSGPLEGVPFWRVYTAQDIGSYKPDPRNFEYLLKHLDEDDRAEGGEGIGKVEVLHVAQSLFHDHRPTKTMGMR